MVASALSVLFVKLLISIVIQYKIVIAIQRIQRIYPFILFVLADELHIGKTSLNIQQIVNTLDNYLDVNAPKNFNWNYSIDLPSETMKLNKLIEVMIRSPIKQKPNTPACLVFEDPVKACFHLALENQLNK